MKKLLFLLLLIPFLGTSQGTFTAPVGYNTGTPTAAPSGVGTRWRFDLLTGKKYTWNPDAMAWDEDPRGIDQISGCSAPLYTPGYNQSTFAINGCTAGQGGPKLYQYSGSAWLCLNCFSGPNIYAGSGITLSGTAPDITISADDNSPTNELQTLSISGQNLTLSNSGGTVAIPGGGSLGTGFTAGGGEGVIPSATGILSGDLILDNTGNYAVRIGDINGGVNGIGMEITDTRFAFGNNFGIGNFSIISNFDGGPSAFYIAITGANDEMKFTPDGVIYTDLGDGLGMGYAARYPDILDTDRSIPDVGLVNELIGRVVLGPLGREFEDGAGDGIFGTATAHMDDAAIFKIDYFTGTNALTVDDEQGSVVIGDKGGTSQMVFNASGISFGSPFGGLVFSDLGSVVSSPPSGEGWIYADDYSADFTARSLIDKGYADSHSGSAIGTGFVNGGGSGILPAGTVANIEADGNFEIKYSNGNTALRIGDDENLLNLYSRTGNAIFTFDTDVATMGGGDFGIILNASGKAVLFDGSASPKGFEYAGDYSTTIKANARSIPDVGTVNIIKQDLVSYTTTQRNAISSPAAGRTIYCSDCTATDSSTGVQQVWNGSTWKNAW